MTNVQILTQYKPRRDLHDRIVNLGWAAGRAIFRWEVVMAARRKKRVRQAEIVLRFSHALRVRRLAAGMSQQELARRAHVTTSYVTRLERATSAPGIDLVDRLAQALGCTVADLLPTTDPPDQTAVLRDQVRRLCDGLTAGSDAHTLSLAAQLLASLASSER